MEKFSQDAGVTLLLFFSYSYSCLVNALKFTTFLITASLDFQQRFIVPTLTRSVLHIRCDWLFAARVTLSGAHTLELCFIHVLLEMSYFSFKKS